MSKFDVTTFEVIRNYLQSLTDSMNTTIWRTAYSTIVRDSRDCSSAILDTKGRLVVQSDSIPSLLGTFELGLQKTLKEYYPIDNLEEGDVIIQNHPYMLSPSHTPDIVLFTPIFFEGKVVSIAASIAHLYWGMKGGKLVSNTIFDSGLKFYPVKLYEKEKINETVVKTIYANIPFPDEAMGDIRAELAANNMGVIGIKELFRKYGKNTVLNIYEELMDYSERRIRAGLDKIPDGKYNTFGFLDSQGPIPYPQDPVRIECTITIKGSDIHYDFTGSSKQSLSDRNAVESAATSVLYYVTRCISDPFCPENRGAHRPITYNFPPGSIFAPRYPAAVLGRHAIAQRTADILINAFVDVIPEKVSAYCCGGTNYQTVSSDKMEFGTFHDMTGGGHGARYNNDGIDAIQVHLSRCVGYPIEIAENIYPVLYKKYELVNDSGGAGKFRGGLGIRRDVQFLCSDARYSGHGKLCHVMPPKGVKGGKPGKPGRRLLNPDTDKEKDIYRVAGGVFEEGDIFMLETPGGGGWGNPLERDPQRVLIDFLDEKISIKSARENYGVIINTKTLKIDDKETETLRRKLFARAEKLS